MLKILQYVVISLGPQNIIKLELLLKVCKKPSKQNAGIAE